MPRAAPPELVPQVSGIFRERMGLTAIPHGSLPHIAALFNHHWQDAKALEASCDLWHVHVYLSGTSIVWASQWLALHETSFSPLSEGENVQPIVHGFVHAKQTLVLAGASLLNQPFGPRGPHADGGGAVVAPAARARLGSCFGPDTVLDQSSNSSWCPISTSQVPAGEENPCQSDMPNNLRTILIIAYSAVISYKD